MANVQTALSFPEKRIRSRNDDLIRFNEIPSKYWGDTTKISYVQRRIIVHSILYYNLNESCITDQQFDLLARQLVRMQNECDPVDFRNSTYYYVFYDFDATTGFHISGRLTRYDRKYLTNIAQIVLSEYKKRKEEEAWE